MNTIPELLLSIAEKCPSLLAAALPFWLPAINLTAFLLFGLDKRSSQQQRRPDRPRRVPEKVLFLLSILGGSLGALAGMQLWSHKTRHNAFRIGIPLLLLIQSAVCILLSPLVLFP